MPEVGVSIWDIGTSPTNFDAGQLIGTTGLRLPGRWGSVFPELMLPTMAVNADGTFSIRMSTTGNYRYWRFQPQPRTTIPFYEDLTFGPTRPNRPAVTVGQGSKSYPANRAQIPVYLRSGGNPELDRWDSERGREWQLQPGTAQTITERLMGGLGHRRRVWNLRSDPDAVMQQLSTGYADSDGDFTLFALFEHNTQLQATPVSGECLIKTGSSSDLSICRNGTVANSWVVTVRSVSATVSTTTDTGLNHLGRRWCAGWAAL